MQDPLSTNFCSVTGCCCRVPLSHIGFWHYHHAYKEILFMMKINIRLNAWTQINFRLSPGINYTNCISWTEYSIKSQPICRKIFKTKMYCSNSVTHLFHSCALENATQVVNSPVVTVDIIWWKLIGSQITFKAKGHI